MSHVARHWRVSVVIALAALMGLLLSPATADAQEARESRTDIRILTDAEFDAAHGVRSGTGTPEDPFVISGWDVHSLYIKDTNRSVVITDNTVHLMTLDWIGRDVTVTDNTVGDLRVNQNVRRTGLPTSGVISNNVFDVVGQLRHWDGEFSHNVVGRPPAQGPLDDLENEIFSSARAVNFDGFNGAHFTENDIYGYVDVRIHGHHHSSAFGHDSHDHGETHDAMDHSQRYHEVFFDHNRITVPAGQHYAVGYQDNGHAGNDRTATSETNPALNDPHMHYTRVHMTDNQLNGAGLYVNIFNSDDERHLGTSRGLLEIDRNTINITATKYLGSAAYSGIDVYRATDVDLYVRDNTINGPPTHTHSDDPTDPMNWITYNAFTGMNLYDVDKALVRLYDNHVSNAEWGIRTSQMTESVRWLIGGLHTENVHEAVYSDSSVANEWEQRPPEEETPGDGSDPGDGHDHGGV